MLKKMIVGFLWTMAVGVPSYAQPDDESKQEFNYKYREYMSKKEAEIAEFLTIKNWRLSNSKEEKKIEALSSLAGFQRAEDLPNLSLWQERLQNFCSHDPWVVASRMRTWPNSAKWINFKCAILEDAKLEPKSEIQEDFKVDDEHAFYDCPNKKFRQFHLDQFDFHPPQNRMNEILSSPKKDESPEDYTDNPALLKLRSCLIFGEDPLWGDKKSDERIKALAFVMGFSNPEEVSNRLLWQERINSFSEYNIGLLR